MIVFSFKPVEFDRDVTPLHEPRFTQSLAESIGISGCIGGLPAVEEGDHGRRYLLSPNAQRCRQHRTTNSAEKHSLPHVCPRHQENRFYFAPGIRRIDFIHSKLGPKGPQTTKKANTDKEFVLRS